MNLSTKEDKLFIFAAVGLALMGWQFGFTLGAYETISFDSIFALWVASLAVLIANFILPKSQRGLSTWTIIALSAPSLWILTLVFSFSSASLAAWVTFFVGTAAFLIAFPVVAHTLLSISMDEGIQRLNLMRITQLAAICLGALVLGWGIGTNHALFLSCDDFERNGTYIPADCSPLTGIDADQT